jgi:hypothetical protein
VDEGYHWQAVMGNTVSEGPSRYDLVGEQIRVDVID